MKGITERRFVITVQAQRDIFPKGRTYPMKATSIARIRRKFPRIQTPRKL
jgi:hypothetical protein